MDLERLKEQLYEFDALRQDDGIQQDSVKRIQPEYAKAWPAGIHPYLRIELLKSGIRKPYQHQADAIKRSLQGYDVLLESPTASGKTLAFTAPMLDALLRDHDAHALMIYPMKALAFDQRMQIRNLCKRLGINCQAYDGDTSPTKKKSMRISPPQILLTNPDYLHLSLLGWNDLWENFLCNLKFIVIDEMHEYRGFFGSNMALLLRRFFLLLDSLGASPRVFLSTATCANPKEHAKNLTGRDIEVISARDILRPQRHFLFVKPEIPDHLYWQILQLRIENAALAILEQDLRALIFCPTKRFLEEAYRNCQRKAEEKRLNPDALSPFHADLKSSTRQQIQKKVKSGEIRIIFTTNALELGLDIGGLDGVILAGFPSNIMSAWQRVGRAGRSWDKDAFVLFYAMNDPIDRFFVSNIKAFLNRPFDQLVVDPANSKLIDNHIPSLLAETGSNLNEADRFILGTTFYNAVKQEGGKPVKSYRPHHNLNLRGGLGNSYTLKHRGKELGQISEMRRFREAYIGAIFTFFGRKYRVRAHEADAVLLEEAEPNLRTDAGFYTVLHQNQIHDGFAYGELEVFHGTLNFQMNFTGYKLVDERTGEAKDSGGSHAALYQNNLHAVWFNVTTHAANEAGIGALENLFRVGAMFVIPADRFDTSTWSTLKDGLTTYYYENYEDGIGVARKFYKVWPNVLEEGIKVAAGCSCAKGCQNCIEPAKSWSTSNLDIDKWAGIELGKKLLAAYNKGPDHKFQNGRLVRI